MRNVEKEEKEEEEENKWLEKMFREIEEEEKEERKQNIYNVTLSPLRRRRGEAVEEICSRGIGISNADPPPPRPEVHINAPGIEEVEEQRIRKEKERLEQHRKDIFKKKNKPEERMLKRKGRSYKW